MFFFFTCGTHTFTSPLKGYENVTVPCHNCGNMSGRVFKRWEWFTFCFVPLVPFSLKPWKEIGCHICNFYQDIKFRPDVTGGQAHGAQQQYQMQPPGPKGPEGPPPPPPGQMEYK
ncbi:hypothetical protein BT63DRAFT_481261 [Microthyrium microscopicum]|uniref:Zinc-ribbon 15 domain-containing protein n=1 Tax=Microthyrium microscopicum TaxID=703497 RepID=A0A6A6U3D1_9PEZI|nr:hypothetical protein BT63DRAFT_481261 [Microthyrium microscopicum]